MVNWFYGLNIRTKLLIPISVISCLVVLMGIIAIERFRIIGNKVNELGEINLLAVGYLLEADTELYKALVEERSMLFLNAEAPDFVASLERHKQSITSARQKLNDFHGLVNGTEIDPVFADYEKARDKWEVLTLTVAREREANTRIGRTTAMEVSFKDANAAFNHIYYTGNVAAILIQLHYHIGRVFYFFSKVINGPHRFTHYLQTITAVYTNLGGLCRSTIGKTRHLLNSRR